MGGEKLQQGLGALSQIGSPPRGRGKVVVFPLFPGKVRITPAWAGKRIEIMGKRVKVKDHPRVGGEKTKKIP